MIQLSIRFWRQYRKLLLAAIWLAYCYAASSLPIPEFVVVLLFLGVLAVTIINTTAVKEL